jgi:hypothetical protein
MRPATSPSGDSWRPAVPGSHRAIHSESKAVAVSAAAVLCIKHRALTEFQRAGTTTSGDGPATERDAGKRGSPSGSHVVPAGAGGCKFNDIVKCRLGDVLESLSGEKALMPRDYHVRKGKQSRKNVIRNDLQ